MLGAEVPPGTTNCAYLKQPDKQELANSSYSSWRREQRSLDPAR